MTICSLLVFYSSLFLAKIAKKKNSGNFANKYHNLLISLRILFVLCVFNKSSQFRGSLLCLNKFFFLVCGRQTTRRVDGRWHVFIKAYIDSNLKPAMEKESTYNVHYTVIITARYICTAAYFFFSRYFVCCVI